MKLIDFLEDEKLQNLLKRMGARRVEYNGVRPKFDDTFIRNLWRGKEVGYEELKLDKNSCFTYGGMKVLVYIRDQIYQSNFEYKFHITNCRTLIGAQQSRRDGRYVVSIKTDGMFSINIRRGSWTEEDKEQKLHVCKNCLGALNYKGYRGASERAKAKIYSGFSIEEYLQSKEEQTIIRPNHTNIDAPLDEYTEDWRDIAENFKRKQSYTCAKCGINLSEDKNFLHVHHIDGLKYNNWDDNLKALCIACHSKEPGHSHMQKRVEFREFQRKYGNRHQRILLFQR